MSKNDKLYDVRVAGRYIKEGMLTQKNYESYIKKLPDVEEKSQILNIDEDEITEETTDEVTTDIEEESLTTENQEETGTEIE
jgi:hypothetical protein